METKVSKFYRTIQEKSIINFPMKICPLFIEEEKRVIERHLILHSHETFTNEREKNFTKSYINSLGNMLYDNRKNFPQLRNSLKLKKKCKRNILLSILNEHKNKENLPSIINNNSKTISDFKNQSIEKKNFMTPEISPKFKSKIKNVDEIQKYMKLLSNDNKKFIYYIASGNKFQKEYQNKTIYRIKKKLENISSNIRKIKAINIV
jgi:hypothetical protein